MPSSSIHISDDTSREEAVNHGRNYWSADDDAYQVQGIDQLYALLTSFLHGGDTFEFMDFHAHGSPGVVGFSGGNLGITTLDRFRNKGFHKLFRPDAEIRFYSCELAKGSSGERFLAEFGAIFLQGNGGEAKGSDSCLVLPRYKRLTHGAPDNEGYWISAYVPPNNTAVWMSNQKWLDRASLYRSITELRNIVVDLMTAGDNKQCRPTTATAAVCRASTEDILNPVDRNQQKENEAKRTLGTALDKMLDKAAALLSPSLPSIQQVYEARDFVNQVARILRKEGVTDVDMNPYITYEER
jgi:hypothetical protein